MHCDVVRFEKLFICLVPILHRMMIIFCREPLWENNTGSVSSFSFSSSKRVIDSYSFFIMSIRSDR